MRNRTRCFFLPFLVVASFFFLRPSLCQTNFNFPRLLNGNKKKKSAAPIAGGTAHAGCLYISRSAKKKNEKEKIENGKRKERERGKRR